MRLLITGVHGFLGSHVASRALEQKHEIVYYNADLVDPDNDGLQDFDGDAIIHCAGVCRWSADDRSDSRFLVNVRMAETLHDLDLKVILPVPLSVFRPWNAYGMSMKRAAWILRESAVHLPTLYGEDDPHHAKLIPSFILGAKNRSIVIYGGGTAVRTYIHVDDAADALISAAAPGALADQADRIVAKASTTSVNDLAKVVVETFTRSSPGPLIEVERRPYSTRRTVGWPAPERVAKIRLPPPPPDLLYEWIRERVAHECRQKP